MTLEQKNELEMPLLEIIKEINVLQLKNQANRTLLYGYDCDRNTWHTYLEHGVIYSVIYMGWDYNANLIYKTESEDGVFRHPENAIPNKRLYPEACDYEFCQLLKNLDCYLPFTTHNDSREEKQFYGLLIQEIKK